MLVCEKLGDEDENGGIFVGDVNGLGDSDPRGDIGQAAYKVLS